MYNLLCIQAIRSCWVIKSLFCEPDPLENRETEESECKMVQHNEDRNVYRHRQFIFIIQ